MKTTKLATAVSCAWVIATMGSPVQLLAASEATLKLHTVAAVTTAACACSIIYGSPGPLGGGCPPGNVYNTWTYQMCVNGNELWDCNNSIHLIGYKWSCTPSYDYVTMSACTTLTGACGWACFWSILPPNPAQMGICALCLSTMGTSCKACDYTSCNSGDTIQVFATAHTDDVDGVPD